MKNVVECPREFFAYFNALETYLKKRVADGGLFEKKKKCVLKNILSPR